MDLNRYRTSWSTRSGQDPGQASAPNRRTLIRRRDQIDLIKFYQKYSNRKIPIICNLRFRQTRNCGSILNTLVRRPSVPDQEQLSEALEKNSNSSFATNVSYDVICILMLVTSRNACDGAYVKRSGNNISCPKHTSSKSM